MNVLKRFTGVLLAIAMLFTAVSLPAAAAGENEVLTIRPNVQEGSVNYFAYSSASGTGWVPGSSEAYIDLGSSNSQAEQCYYEVPFMGNGIEVFAVKSYNHGKVRYSVDGDYVETVDLYNSSRTEAQSVYAVSGLAEGEHVLKAVTLNERTGSAVVNQVAYVQVTHAPYEATDVELALDSLQMTEGQTYTIAYTTTPDYAADAELVFESSDDSVASVSAAGVITAEGKGAAVITVTNAGRTFSKTIDVKVTEAVPQMGGTIGNTNRQYTQDRYEEMCVQNVTEKSLSAWKNDKAISELVLFSKNCALKNVTITASDLKAGRFTIDASNVTATFIKSALAYNKGSAGYGSKYGTVPEATEENRSETSDILYQTEPMDIPYNSLQPVWVTFEIPKDAVSGSYQGTLTVTADDISEPLVFTYTVEVENAVLPDAEEFGSTFDIELWQYPYTSAEYYGVEPFSDEHLKIMESSMLIYKEIGGHAITASIVEEAWSGQTYSKNETHYPSMIKWTKNSDGTFTYDYTDFDKWITFNKSLGLGDKIVLYSIAPWHNSFTYWENGELVYEAFSAGSARYTAVWTDFLTDLVAHLTEKGWFEDSYIGIDERGFSNAAFDLIDSVTNENGESLKTAGAMDAFVDKRELALRVDDLNVGDTAAAASPAAFQEVLAERESLGLRTTLYSCVGHTPGNFSLSMPMESYWTIVNAGKSGTAGFLRWAYDAWVENPLEDTTHSSFEPGDCFLIFPDLKTAENPISKKSVRLEKMAEGVRDVNKLMQIEKEMPELADQIDALYDKITVTAAGGIGYMSSSLATRLESEMNAFKEGLAEISAIYAEAQPDDTPPIEMADEKLLASLGEQITEAEALKADEYTAESWAAYKVALKAAKDIQAKQEITKEEAEEVLENLKAAISGLKKKEAETETPGGTVTPGTELPAVGSVHVCGKAQYKVTASTVEGGTVTYMKPTVKTLKKITVPATVKIQGLTYKVTEIAANAMKNNKKLAKVVIGKHVQTIGKAAFSGDKSLKNVTVKSAVLKKVGKKALKGIHAKAKIKVPKKQLPKYTKLFRKKGQKATVKVVK